MFITAVGMLIKQSIYRFHTVNFEHTLLGKKVFFVHIEFSTGLSTRSEHVMNIGEDVQC